MKKFSSINQRKGEIGEMIACKYLKKRGFRIVDRNYTRKWGEIDIIASKNKAIHFIEVKSVSCENMAVRPEEQIHAWKQRKLAKTMELYINDRTINAWQFDVICVYMDFGRRKAKVKYIENVVF